MPTLHGPRGSGRTTALIATVATFDIPTLVITAWPWERVIWQRAFALKKTVAVHTPESLARTILEKWELRSKKTLVWKTSEIAKGCDPETQARNLLKEGIITADTAHWLLRENLDDILHWKQPIALLVFDDSCHWEPEALDWIKTLPHKQKLETGPGPGIIWMPGKKPRLERWAEVEYSDMGAGQWVMGKLYQDTPKNKKIPLLVIQTEKEKWQAYLTARNTAADIRHATECEGRNWHEALIPSLRKSWGGPGLAMDWLELVVSRCNHRCLIRIGPDGPPSWLPENPEKKKFLIWEPLSSCP